MLICILKEITAASGMDIFILRMVRIKATSFLLFTVLWFPQIEPSVVTFPRVNVKAGRHPFWSGKRHSAARPACSETPERKFKIWERKSLSSPKATCGASKQSHSATEANPTLSDKVPKEVRLSAEDLLLLVVLPKGHPQSTGRGPITRRKQEQYS